MLYLEPMGLEPLPSHPNSVRPELLGRAAMETPLRKPELLIPMCPAGRLVLAHPPTPMLLSTYALTHSPLCVLTVSLVWVCEQLDRAASYSVTILEFLKQVFKFLFSLFFLQPHGAWCIYPRGFLYCPHLGDFFFLFAILTGSFLLPSLPDY